MGRSQTDEFERFVAARWSALNQLGSLLTGGDRQRAEDLVQEALVKLWSAWSRVADEAPEAYARTVLVRLAARSARRRWWGERPSEQVPEVEAAGDLSASVAERTKLEAALAQLPPRQRAAVVLRYYQDMSESQVAEMLGAPIGTVRSHTRRGVERLRQIFADVNETAG
ncbi:SigE family RNA polymerase sigma factor [Catenulispora pinisilvae]|uniref:SigE family RNA polymerase sigma factor n=1 Tax=Catenulispora pinisilvae TaxID=2705253 RepID=UPI0018918ABB|nr:SigE family RNA polymerase sigma factor [Catenulispora pinisilvae]